MNITIVVCMKNEGPFLLEWLAHHRAVGVNQFIVFSNDCTDGSRELLDALDNAGVIQHLENPNCLVQSERRIDVAFGYAQKLNAVRNADYVGMIDADEFINIKVGDGTFKALFAEIEPFDVLSYNHVNFGFGGVMRYDPAPITGQFHMTCGEQVGQGARARTSIKSLFRPREDFQAMNHFPRMGPEAFDDLVWLDGSGHRVAIDPQKPRRKMLSIGGRTDLVQINHYVLRSVESFLLKHDRGNMHGFEKWDARKYVEEYNLNRVADHTIAKSRGLRRRGLRELKELPGIADLHEACVIRHRERIEALLKTEHGAALYAHFASLMEQDELVSG